MRRRRALDVWPSYADLMTVLAVIGLLTAAGVLRRDAAALAAERRSARQLMDQEARVQELVRQAADARKAATAARSQCREAAINQGMFQAIQEVQRRIDEISTRSGLRFNADQSLQFGDDLVEFAPSKVDPIWHAGGRDQLRAFCRVVARALSSGLVAGSRAADPGSKFIIEVEGHTDSTPCPGNPHCNWLISSGRAANFMAVMREPESCPGGAAWSVRSIGYADTKPPPGLPPTRRIAVRLTPDYGRIISAFKSVSQH